MKKEATSAKQFRNSARHTPFGFRARAQSSVADSTVLSESSYLLNER